VSCLFFIFTLKIIELSGIKIPGYLTDSKIRHPVRSLKIHHRSPSKTDLPKAPTACQSLEARNPTSIPPEPCRKVSGEIGALGGSFRLAPSPHDVIKAPDPLGILPPRPRDTWSPLARRGATGPPTAALTSTDGTDVTVHSQQEHGNHALTQHDPGHSTTMTSIPLQRRGDGNYTT
jgi:hypothetical protein